MKLNQKYNVFIGFYMQRIKTQVKQQKESKKVDRFINRLLKSYRNKFSGKDDYCFLLYFLNFQTWEQYDYSFNVDFFINFVVSINEIAVRLSA